MSLRLQQALDNVIWKEHSIGDTYIMDGNKGWKIAYYPIFECGKSGEVYNEPRVLVEKKENWKGVEGIDFREVPLHYLTKEK